MKGRCIEGNCYNGQGTFTNADGDKYVGEWKDDEMLPKGVSNNNDSTHLYH
jgi:hypothetical protein